MKFTRSQRLTHNPILYVLFVLSMSGQAVSQEKQIHLTYCVDPAWAPYESIDNGQHVGMSKHYLDIIKNKLNIRLTLMPTVSWQDTLTAIAEEKCHLTPMVNHSIEREKTIAFSNSYLHTPNAIYAHMNLGVVGNINSLTDQTIAVVTGYRMTEHLEKNFPNLNMVEVSSEEEGLMKVNTHQVDLFIGSFYSANLIINEYALSNIRIVGIAELENLLRIGVSLNNKHLIPKINQALAELTEADHNGIFKTLNKSKVVNRVDYTLVWQIISLCLVLFIILGTRYYYELKQRKVLAIKNTALERLRSALEAKNQQLAELAIKDHLTGLHNRKYLSEQIDECVKLKKRYQTPCCMLLIDIDDFKKINDLHGHHIGDEVLVTLSQKINECARETDITARWGGEEFVILCPSTSLNDALNLANRFQLALESYDFEHLTRVSCSIGIAELGENQCENQWFCSADQAMYQAKVGGKNQIKIA